MNATLKVADLKRFKQLSAGIKTTNIISALSYLKFDNGEIIKSNMGAFVIMGSAFSGSFLLDERILMSLVDITTTETISVSVTEKQVTISNGKIKKTHPFEPIINFPKTNVEGEGKLIPQQAIDAIATCYNFTIKNDINVRFETVFVGNGHVCSFTGFSAYMQKITEPVEQIIINREAGLVISKLTDVSFCENGSYQLFRSGDVCYGFSKTEIGFFDMTMRAVLPDIKPVELDKKEIIQFCDMVVTDNNGLFVSCSFTGNKLVMNNNLLGSIYEQELPIEVPPFTFNPGYLSRLLKSVEGERLQFYIGQNASYITNNGEYIAVLQGVNILNK